jgi:Lon protease-like protein
MTTAQQRAKAALEWWNSFTSCHYKEHEDTIRKALTAMAADVPDVITIAKNVPKGSRVSLDSNGVGLTINVPIDTQQVNAEVVDLEETK